MLLCALVTTYKHHCHKPLLIRIVHQIYATWYACALTAFCSSCQDHSLCHASCYLIQKALHKTAVQVHASGINIIQCIYCQALSCVPTCQCCQCSPMCVLSGNKQCNHMQVACPSGCQDEVYCSQQCASAAWDAHHSILCCQAPTHRCCSVLLSSVLCVLTSASSVL